MYCVCDLYYIYVEVQELVVKYIQKVVEISSRKFDFFWEFLMLEDVFWMSVGIIMGQVKYQLRRILDMYKNVIDLILCFMWRFDLIGNI